MDLCSEQHDEICYDGIRCPACEVINELKSELEYAQKELASAEEKIELLEEEE